MPVFESMPHTTSYSYDRNTKFHRYSPIEECEKSEKPVPGSIYVSFHFIRLRILLFELFVILNRKCVCSRGLLYRMHFIRQQTQ